MTITLLILALLGPLAVVLLAAKRSLRNRQRIRANLIASLAESDRNAIYPVKYASRRRYRKFWKIFPWEGAGILFPQSEGFRAVVQTSKGDRVSFDVSPSEVEWLGRKHWYINGANSWLIVTDHLSPHYLSPEHGIWIFGNCRKTKELYELLTKKTF